jgi:dipeptide/tripeptide permease
VSFAQSIQYLSTIVAPLVGTFLGDHIGVGPALAIAGGVRLAGFLMFYFGKPVKHYAGLEEPARVKSYTAVPENATESSKIVSN